MHKADATDAIALLESEDPSLFTFCGDVVIFVRVINDEWKGRRMSQHVCDGRASCTDKEKGSGKMLSQV